MKTVFMCLFFAVLFNSNSILSQNVIGQKPEKNVPFAVSSAFNAQFPSQDPVWFSEYRGRFDQKLIFEARFILANRYTSAFYGKEGDFVALAIAINYIDVPNEIQKYMKTNFPSYSVLDSILVTRKNGDKTYELGIIVDGEYIVKVFSETGDFIKSVRA